MATIELRTHAPALVPTILHHDNSWHVGTCHDALASHCYRQAIEEAWKDHFRDHLDALEWIENRAAELLRQYLDQSGGE